MAGFKASRMSEDIKREVYSIIRELKDPRVKDSMLSIVKADVSGDLSHCKLYISDIAGFDKSKEAVKGLESASGFIKRELSNRLHLRRCPELKFIADDSIEQGANINRIIEDLS
ncbi:MAG: rbfA [Oscillospiraceae bacterium]|jgi:ribosome-binding factor A|nr:rbfA [Oscillospiraceae bacterium]